jgi:AraC family transcriptional regulator
MPQAWDGIVVEIYRARDANFADAQSDHVVSLQLRGLNGRLQNAGHANSKRSPVGNINITPRGELNRWRYDGEAEIAVLRIAPSLLESVAAMEAGESVANIELAKQSGIRDAQIEHLGIRLIDELTRGGLASRTCVHLLAKLLAIHLLRHYSKGPDVADEPSSKLARHRLRQVTDYVNKNLRNDLSLEKISEALCMSPCHFAHLFKRTTGLTPHRYVIDCRIEKAKSLLRETNFLVNEIAQMVGYSNQSHFSTVFRQSTGQSPLRFRSEV